MAGDGGGDSLVRSMKSCLASEAHQASIAVFLRAAARGFCQAAVAFAAGLPGPVLGRSAESCMRAALAAAMPGGCCLRREGSRYVLSGEVSGWISDAESCAGRCLAASLAARRAPLGAGLALEGSGDTGGPNSEAAAMEILSSSAESATSRMLTLSSLSGSLSTLPSATDASKVAANCSRR